MHIGQRVLITGANGGVGISICEAFLKNNADLVLIYHQDRDKIDELLEKNPEFVSKVEVHQVNLLSDKKISQKMKVVLNSKPINIFIHSVSLPLKMKGVRELHWKDFQEHLDIQVKSFFKIVQLLIPKMKNATGKNS